VTVVPADVRLSPVDQRQWDYRVEVELCEVTGIGRGLCGGETQESQRQEVGGVAGYSVPWR
jgi:hypothetical protein